MTYKNLQDECILLRFDESRRASVKSWLNTRYAAIWSMEDWYFKHVTGVPFTVTAGDDGPTMFSDFAAVEGLFDNNGDPLRWLPQRIFEEVYLGDTSSSTPREYTIVDRQIILGPTPSATTTFYISYRRRLSHVDGPSGLNAAGIMVNDSDQPIWGAEYDYLLVLEAAILGCELLEFPAAELSSQRDGMLQALLGDALHSQQSAGVEIWGE